MNPGVRRRLAAAACALALGGCPSLLRPPRVGPEAPRVADRDAEKRYQQILDRWTRRAEIYDGLDSRAFLAATFQSFAFLQARVERVAALRSLPLAEAEAMLSAERKAHQESLEVVLGLHANDRRFDDLGRPGSIWTIALVGEAGEVQPTSVEKLPLDPNLKALYPYLDTFWAAYRLRFPRTFENGAQVLPEKAQSFALRLSSAVGKAELRWELAAPPAAGAVAWP